MLRFPSMEAHLLPLAALVGAAAVSGLAACGARTGLLGGSQPAVEGGSEGVDAGIGEDAGFAPPDAPIPPIDASVGIDARPGTAINDCPDAGDTLVYLVTSLNS